MTVRRFLRLLFRWALILLIGAGFWYYENYVLDTEVCQLTSPRLPDAFDGFRVVELADLHGMSFGPGNERLLEAVRAAEPDLIAIDGDLADDPADLAVVGSLARGLTEIAPTYYVTGNHEWGMEGRQTLFDLLEDAGVRVLHNQFVQLTLGGQSIIVAGVDDPNGPYDQKTPEALVAEIRAAAGDPYILMLAHRNDQLDQWAALEVDTVLTGHGHGGVIRLPIVGGLVGPGRELLPDYIAGIYQQGRTTQFVSRGLGHIFAPVRLFNRPHLPILVLRKERE